MNFQIRIRTDVVFEELDYVKSWINDATESFAFEHSKPDNHHFHLYLFDLDRNADAMRKFLFKQLKDKTRYSVKTSAGKPGQKQVPITKEKAWVYASNPKSFPQLVHYKLTNGDLERDVYNGLATQYYEKLKGPVDHTVFIEERVEVKADKTWLKLMEGVSSDRNIYDGKKIPEIKSMISVSYLRELRAVPRPSDLHRYAVSLFYITKYNLIKDGNDLPDHALVPEYNNGSF